MDWVTTLILLTGLLRLFIGFTLAHMAWKTWYNPHPVGRTVMPEFVLILSGIFLNDALRSISFVFSTQPVYYYMENQGIVNMVFSHVLTFVLCLLMFIRTKRVEYEFTKTLN